MSVAIFFKAIVIAICAALAAAFYFLAYSIYDGSPFGEPERFFRNPAVVLWPTLFGSFAIGLPIALLTFLFSWRHLVRSPTTLAMVTVLAGIMMVLASFALGSEDGVLALGIPAFIAALTYGLLGWFWILKPLRKAQRP